MGLVFVKYKSASVARSHKGWALESNPMNTSERVSLCPLLNRVLSKVWVIFLSCCCARGWLKGGRDVSAWVISWWAGPVWAWQIVHLLAAHYLQAASIRNCEWPKGRKRQHSDKFYALRVQNQSIPRQGSGSREKVEKVPESALL